MNLFWCPTCGVVWADIDAPICHHYVRTMLPPPRRMEPIPTWHPYHPMNA